MGNEITVRLHAPLRGARLVDPGAPLPLTAPPEATPGINPTVVEAPEEEATREREPPEGDPTSERVLPPVADAPGSPLPVADTPGSPENGSPDDAIARRLDEERAMIEQALAAVSQHVRQLTEARSQERREWRRLAVELGVTLAARLLHDRIVAGEFPVETLVREMIGQVDGGPVVVYLSPDDLALLQKRLEGRPLAERAEGISYQADPTLGRGDCRVEAGEALVLSELDMQLADMRRRLLRSLGHAQS